MQEIDEDQIRRWPLRHEIPRIEGLSRADFERDFILGPDGHGRPAIIRNATPGWGCNNWSLDSFRARFGSLSVRSHARSSRVAPYEVVSYEMTLAEHIDYCRGGELGTPPVNAKSVSDRADLYPQSGSLYWYESLARPEFHALWNDVDVDFEFMDSLMARLEGDWRRFAFHLPFANVFIGGAGSCVDLHKDYWSTHTLIVHLEGFKHVMAFPRTASACIKNARNEPIDPRRPDEGEFPHFRDAPVHIGTIAPGDTLFLPPNWYHDVLGLSPTLSFGMNLFTVHNIGPYLSNLLSHPLQLFEALRTHPGIGPTLRDESGSPLGDRAAMVRARTE